MTRLDGRILTTHCGSLPRPLALVDLLDRQERGEAVCPAVLAHETNAAVRAAVVRQLDAGIDMGNNGEAPRPSFATYVAVRMRGLGAKARRPWPDCVEFPDFGRMWADRAGRLRLASGTGRSPGAAVEYHGLDAAAAECDQFLECTERQSRRFTERFMTAVSPGVIARVFENRYYDSYERYVYAVARQMQREYELVHAKGMLLQIDAPDLASHRAWYFHDAPLSAFLDTVQLNIDALNLALERIPAHRVRLHVCWANFEAPHVHDVPLIDVLPLLCEANVGALSVEMANPRHQHEYKALRQHRLPDTMGIIPGVIDSKTNYVEHPEVVADRLVRVARAIDDPSRVVAGVDCGFATISGFTAVAESVVWRKLQSLRAGADIAAQQLWNRTPTAAASCR